MMILDRIIAQMVEAAFREGWSAGYSAGLREDAASGTYWCDEEGDWKDSEAAKAIEARSDATGTGAAEGESAVRDSEFARNDDA